MSSCFAYPTSVSCHVCPLVSRRVLVSHVLVSLVWDFLTNCFFISTSWFLRFLRPRRNQKRGNCPGQVHRELGMPWSGLYGATPSPVGITYLVAKTAKLVHDGLAVAEDSFEALLGVLIRGEVEGGRALGIKLGRSAFSS